MAYYMEYQISKFLNEFWLVTWGFRCGLSLKVFTSFLMFQISFMFKPFVLRFVFLFFLVSFILNSDMTHWNLDLQFLSFFFIFPIYIFYDKRNWTDNPPIAVVVTKFSKIMLKAFLVEVIYVLLNDRNSVWFIKVTISIFC